MGFSSPRIPEAFLFLLLVGTPHADTGGGGFKRYFEEIAAVLKKHFPDVIIEREIVEVCGQGSRGVEVVPRKFVVPA